MSHRSARSVPGSADPFITNRSIDHSFRYLLLMTDGVYKSIENTSRDQSSNEALVSMLKHAHGNFQELSLRLLEKIQLDNRKCFFQNARKDKSSPTTIACRKVDDMTLLVYKFPRLSSNYN